MDNCNLRFSPDIVINKNECTKILDQFDNIDILSEDGTFGIIYKVKHKDTGDQLALKILSLDGDDQLVSVAREINISCDLTKLVKQNLTGSFIMTKLWVACIPYKGWDNAFGTGGDLAYIFMNMADDSFQNYIYDFDKKYSVINDVLLVSMLFELFYALMVGKKTLQFKHNDMRPDNYLIKVLSDEGDGPHARKYQLGGKTFYVNSPYQIMLADFGMSSSKNDKFDLPRPVSDFYHPFNSFINYLKRNNETSPLLAPLTETRDNLNFPARNSGDWEFMIGELLENPIFKLLLNKSSELNEGDYHSYKPFDQI